MAASSNTIDVDVNIKLNFSYYWRRGLFRNTLGSEIIMTGPLIGDRRFFGVWQGYQKDSLFGNQYLYIAPDFLQNCGYEFIGPVDEDGNLIVESEDDDKD